MADPVRDRVVMLLQGPRSPFFARLADALAARGARVERVLFCPGDELYWLGRPARRFRGALADWPAWVARALDETGATDMVGLGDGRPLHRAGFAVARERGALVHVVEQGFLRPGFLTLEPDRLAGWRFDPRAASGPAPAAPRFRASFAAFAAMDVAYDLANLAAGRALYAGYRRHELRHPVSEWAGWIGKALAAPRRARARAATLARIAAAKGPVFLLALQLETDFQLRDRGPPDGQRGALARTLASFHARAAPDALLVVKPHPLDPEPGLWRRLSADARVAFLDGGSLEALFPRLAGLVTVNSTAGLSALRAGVSVLALGEAIYDAPGLTHRGGLDGFWTAPERPDPAFVAAFVAALGAIQTPGGFDGEGMRPGAEGVAAMILARRPGARAASAA